MSFSSLKQVLEQRVSQREELRRGVTASRVKALWRQETEKRLGTEAAQLCTPSSLRGSELELVCRDPALAQEVRYREEEIRTSVNEQLGRELLRRVRYRTG